MFIRLSKSPVIVGKNIPPGFWSQFKSVVLCCCGRRGWRRSVALISGGRSRKALRGQPRRRSTLRNLSPKKEKSSAKPARSGQSRRSGENNVLISVVQCGCVRLWVASAECGDHEEGDRRGWCRSLQSAASAEEKKRFLLQRSRQ